MSINRTSVLFIDILILLSSSQSNFFIVHLPKCFFRFSFCWSIQKESHHHLSVNKQCQPKHLQLKCAHRRTNAHIQCHTLTYKYTQINTRIHTLMSVKRKENQWNRRPIEMNQVKLPIHCNNLFCWLNFVSVNKNTMFHHQNSE